VSDASQPNLALPPKIGPYIPERMLGRGAMGIVYAARHEDDGNLVAIKILPLEQLGEDREHSKQRFQREVVAASALNHPGCVRVYGSGQAQVPGVGDVLYYTMELINGETLHDALKTGAFVPHEAVAIVVELAEALRYAHTHGIIHRDVKPGNIFITDDRRIVLADFGICKLTTVSSLTQTGVLVGTLPYLAPEQLLSEQHDARSDLFSIGALLFTLVTARYLRPSTSLGAIVQAVAQGSDVERARALTGLDPQLHELIVKAVAIEPDDRFQTAAKMAEAFRPFAGSVPLPGTDRLRPEGTDTLRQQMVVEVDDADDPAYAKTLETPRIDQAPDAKAPSLPAQGKRASAPSPRSYPARTRRWPSIRSRHLPQRRQRRQEWPRPSPPLISRCSRLTEAAPAQGTGRPNAHRPPPPCPARGDRRSLPECC